MEEKELELWSWDRRIARAEKLQDEHKVNSSSRELKITLTHSPRWKSGDMGEGTLQARCVMGRWLMVYNPSYCSLWKVLWSLMSQLAGITQVFFQVSVVTVVSQQNWGQQNSVVQQSSLTLSSS